MKVYTGIGSRQTPANVLSYMTAVAEHLKSLGYWLRSGHAQGADWAFEQGATDRSIIYLPWPRFGQDRYQDDPGRKVLGVPVCDQPKWVANYETLINLGIRKKTETRYLMTLHGSNVAQVLGHLPNSLGSEFVVCWCPVTSHGPEGGTRTAILLANHHNIPVYNLFYPEHMRALEHMINGLPSAAGEVCHATAGRN